MKNTFSYSYITSFLKNEYNNSERILCDTSFFFRGITTTVGSEVHGARCSVITPNSNDNQIPIFSVLVCSGCTLTSTRDGCSCPCPTY